MQYTNPQSQVGFYAGLNLIAWGMIFCFVRETKQLTLEELDRKSQHTHTHFRPLFNAAQLTQPSTEVFSVPTNEYIKHESTVWLPYLVKKYLFRKNVPKPPPIIEKAEEIEADKKA